MNLLVLFLIAIASAERNCKGIYFNDKYYGIEILKEGLNKVHQIIFNRKDNTLYIIYEDITVPPVTLLGYFNTETHESGIINGIINATAITIDYKRNKVYVGGTEGLYTLNQYKVPEKLPVYDSILGIFYRDELYYSNTKKEVWKFEDGYTDRVYEFQRAEVENFVIDNDGTVLFVRNKQLFRTKLGSTVVTAHEGCFVDVLTIDAYNKPYVCTKDGIYGYNKYKFALDKVSHMSNLKALTFNEENEAIYVVADVLVKLNYNPVPCQY